jgi:type I restriction enzyme, R subunit
MIRLGRKYYFVYLEEKLITLSKKVKEVVDDKMKYTDWSQRVDIKAELMATTPSATAVSASR